MEASFPERSEPGGALELSERCARLRSALAYLPAKYRRALVNQFVHGYSVKQIAQRHRVPQQGTVLSRIFNCKRILRASSAEAW